jgi:hypothetical protein
VLRELDKLGLANIGHELVTDVLVYKQRAARVPSLVAEAKPAKKTGDGKGHGGRRYDVTNRDFVLQYFKGREQVTAGELRDLFANDGRDRKSSGSVLSLLSQQKYCKSMGEGVWKVLIKGQKEVENG